MQEQNLVIEEEPGGAARWVGVVLILIGLAVVVWQALQTEEVQPAAPLQAAPAPEPPNLNEMLGRNDGPAPFAAPASSPLVSAVAAAASAPLAKDEIEVCGVGRVKVGGQGMPKELKALEEPLNKARARMLTTLASGSEIDRAIGLFLQGVLLPQVLAPKSDVSASASVGATTPTNAAIESAATANLAKPDPVAIDELARLAVASPSPQVYALALQACERRPGEGACQMLSAEQWSRVDPGNAAPWIRLADQAGKRGDTMAVADTVFHITHSVTNDTHATNMAKLALARIPADAPAYVRTMLASEVMGLGLSSAPPYAALNRHCDKAAMVDNNRLQACSGAAETLTARSSGTLDLAVGTAIAERAGWPDARVKTLRDERDAAIEKSTTAMGPDSDVFSCAALDRQYKYISAVATYGELGALRMAVKQTPGESVTVLAQRYRDKRSKAAEPAVARPASALR